MPDDTAPSFEFIDQLVGGYRAAQVILAANELGLFAGLEEAPLRSSELAAKLGLDARAVRIVCDALVALSILRKSEQGYQHTPASFNFLLPNRKTSRTAILLHAAALYERWAGLVEVVRTGKPVPDESLTRHRQRSRTDFAMAMADIGRQLAGATAAAIDLSGASTMLDLGGGPGLFAIEFVVRNPNLQAVILDDPETLEVARKNAENAGVAERIRLQPGDGLTDPLGEDFDFILISNFVHIFSAEQNLNTISRCARALANGGLLCVKDFLYDPGRTGPINTALFAVNMLINTETGDCYTLQEVRSWMEAGGLQFEKSLEVDPRTHLILGRKTVHSPQIGDSAA